MNLKKRILAADDDPSVQRLIERILKSFGYAVEVVSSGEAALVEFRKDGFSLVLTDLQMGKNAMNGIELAEKIKEINPAMPVVLFAGTLPQVQPVCIDWMIGKPARPKVFARLAEFIK